MFSSKYSSPLLTRVLLCCGLVGALSAQQKDRASLLRSLNDQVLALHGEARSATDRVRAGTNRTQATELLRERARLMARIIQEDPAAALDLAFSDQLRSELAELYPDAADQVEVRGSWAGSAEYIIVDDASMTRHESLVRVQEEGGHAEIYFPGEPPQELGCDKWLQVDGVRLGSKIAAASSSVTSLAAGGCSTTGTQNVAVLLVTFPGVTPPYSASTIYNYFFSPTGRSLQTFWRENSYGGTSITGNVFGWYSLGTSYTCDQYTSIGQAAINAASNDVNFSNYSRVFVVFPAPGCSFAGVSNVGCSSKSSPTGNFTASMSYLVVNYMDSLDHAVHLAAHEGGHGLGVSHSTTSDFGSQPLGALGSLGSVTEYGDNFSMMGGWNMGHYPAQMKNYLKWFPSAGNIQSVSSPGTYTIYPMETPTSGPQALKVQRGTNNSDSLWLEYRQNAGLFDNSLSSQVWSGALIHYAVGSMAGDRSYLLDFAPSTTSWNGPALAAGQSWTDPYSNLSLSVVSANANALTVNVNYTVQPCTQSAPTLTLSPSNPSVEAGGKASYSATIKNNDSSACSSSTFSLSSSLPAGWGTTLTPSAVTLSPGQSATIAVSKAVPSSTPPATYTVDLVAAADTRTQKSSAYCSVTAPPPPISLSLSTPGTSFALRSTIPIVVKATANGAPVSGVSINITLQRPKGTTTQAVTTDVSGTGVWSYKPTQKGSYTATAQTTSTSSQWTTATLPSVTFSVQ